MWVLFFFVLLYLFTFSRFATKFNSKMTSIQNLEGVKKMPNAKRKEIDEKICEIGRVVIVLKNNSFKLFGFYFVAHLGVNLYMSYRWNRVDMLMEALYVFLVSLLFMLVLYWLKGASVMPSVLFDGEDLFD